MIFDANFHVDLNELAVDAAHLITNFQQSARSLRTWSLVPVLRLPSEVKYYAGEQPGFLTA